jgi:hypothetical protein
MRARLWTFLITLVPALLLAAGGLYCWSLLHGS